MLIEYLNNNQETYKIAIASEASALDHELVMQLWLKLQTIEVSKFPSPCGVKVVGNPIVLKSIYDLIFKVQILQ